MPSVAVTPCLQACPGCSTFSGLRSERHGRPVAGTDGPGALRPIRSTVSGLIAAACAGVVDAAGHTEKVALSQGDWSGIEESWCQMTRGPSGWQGEVVRDGQVTAAPPDAPAEGSRHAGPNQVRLDRLGSRVLKVRSHR